MAETLQDQGISWKVYMEEDNFDDNGFAWFDTFQKAKPGSVLYVRTRARAPLPPRPPSLSSFLFLEKRKSKNDTGWPHLILLSSFSSFFFGGGVSLFFWRSRKDKSLNCIVDLATPVTVKGNLFSPLVGYAHILRSDVIC